MLTRWFLAHLSIVLNIVRLYVALQFHERLGLVTKTFSRAWTDMYHFLWVVESLVMAVACPTSSVHGLVVFCRNLRSYIGRIYEVAILLYSPFDHNNTRAHDCVLRIIFIISIIMLSFLGWNLLGADSPEYRDFFWTLQMVFQVRRKRKRG